MKYLKNVEWAEMYKVSPNTIGNWIDAAREKKINLQIEKYKSKYYILNTAHNQNMLDTLSKKGKKFKNTKALKVITPTKEFFKIFNEKQIIDIITNLEIYKEIPLKYSYFDEGANYWNNYVNESVKNNVTNTPTNTIQLLDINSELIYSLIKNYKFINVIDLGAGNGLPVKIFLEYLHQKKILNKYIAIDYSNDMLAVAKTNISKWFGNKFETEYHLRDFTYDAFRDLLFIKNKSKNEQELGMNIVLFIGTTIENQNDYKQPLEIIKNSMGPNDLLILGQRLDTNKARQALGYFSYDKKVKEKREEYIFSILSLLNIKSNLYSIERQYNESIRSRIVKVRLNYDLKITIDTPSFYKVINLSNKDCITVFRHSHHTFTEVVTELDNTGFEPLHASTSADHEQILAISALKTL